MSQETIQKKIATLTVLAAVLLVFTPVLFFFHHLALVSAILLLEMGLLFVIYGIKKPIKDIQKQMQKKVIDLEMQCYSGEAFLKKLIQAGTELISEQEKDALIKRVRDSFGGITKASCGYLLMYNLNKNVYEWGIGFNLSNLKLKSQVIPPSDALLGKILANTQSIIQFHILSELESSGMLHIRGDVYANLNPKPDVLITIRLQMKTSPLGIQFLFVTGTQADDIKRNVIGFEGLVNMTTLALGSAVQREFAINDRMTMMYNHEYFVHRLREEIAMCNRSKTRNLSLLMMDIDHFKKFNDTYGHQIGDLVLIETSAVYKECVRMSDVVARYGGEEFAIILPETRLEDAVKVAEKIRRAVEAKEYKTDKGTLHVTISIGVCTWKPDNDPPLTDEFMVKLADVKLYECKEKGRNRVCY